MRALFFLFFIFLSSSTSFALSDGNIHIKGVLKSYNKNTAVLMTSKGEVRVPRKSLGNLKGYISGTAVVMAKVQPKKYLALNKKPTKKK